jgi:hypothetical protein
MRYGTANYPEIAGCLLCRDIRLGCGSQDISDTLMRWRALLHRVASRGTPWGNAMLSFMTSAAGICTACVHAAHRNRSGLTHEAHRLSVVGLVRAHETVACEYMMDLVAHDAAHEEPSAATVHLGAFDCAVQPVRHTVHKLWSLVGEQQRRATRARQEGCSAGRHQEGTIQLPRSNTK